MKYPNLVSTLLFCLSSASLSAAVTYVDATMANTDNAAGGADSTWLDGNDASVSGTATDGSADSDGQWRYRGGFGSDGIFEATGSTAEAENAVGIVTTIGGLADGTYDIYVFFRASTTGADNYNIKASLSPTVTDSDVYRQNNTRSLSSGTLGIDSAGLTFEAGAAPSTANGDSRVLLYGIIGQAVVSGGSDVDIYIDDLPALGYTGDGGLSAVRTWYDGVGFEGHPRALLSPSRWPESSRAASPPPLVRPISCRRSRN